MLFMPDSPSVQSAEMSTPLNSHTPNHRAEREMNHPTPFANAGAKDATKRVKCNVIIVAILGFLLIGVASIGCVAFGILEIASGDAIFLNNGLGEVLTTLGVYFSVPYLCILIVFINTTVGCPFIGKRDWGHVTQNGMWVFSMLIYILQQSLTDKYLTILHGPKMQYIIIADVAVFFAFLYFRFERPYGGMGYTLLYMVKLALMWDSAYKTEEEPFFGPNGMICMLFLGIPVIQFPLYVATSVDDSDGSSAPGRRRVHLVERFTNNFNLYLSHLFHSLDVITLFSFAFVPHTSTDLHTAAPRPFRTLLLAIVCCTFAANNCSVLYLFYNRKAVDTVQIKFLPKTFREVANQQRSLGSDADAEAASYQNRMFQYLLVMLIVCDVPLFIARVELWRNLYTPLSIFIAKNIKSIADAVVLMVQVRTRKNTTTSAAAPTQQMLHSPATARSAIPSSQYLPTAPDSNTRTEEMLTQEQLR